MRATAPAWRAALGWLSDRARRLLPRPITCREAVESVLDVPGSLAGTAVLVGPEGMPEQWLAFDCPCGQGHRLLMNLSTARSPRWRLALGRRGAVSLAPSVDSHSAVGRCHFWLRDGYPVWVPVRQDERTPTDGRRRPRP